MAEDAPARSSKLHLDVSGVLQRMGVNHTNELSVPVLGYHVDIAILPGPGITHNARKIALEVDGPTHYDSERRLVPKSEMKRRHLALAGWRVLAVPWWEWRELQGHARKAYLAALLGASSHRASSSGECGTVQPGYCGLGAGDARASGAPEARLSRGSVGVRGAQNRASAGPCRSNASVETLGLGVRRGGGVGAEARHALRAPERHAQKRRPTQEPTPAVKRARANGYSERSASR
ncbi:hypothetical protein T492DRAFT_842074 [Pavlovales sp. CCMP2436]|nr:hypothetical protein T492DRAFT_842074 [Pavlovales sp. CCMP2436]|mmetsp:Transcript_40185/g.94726  ORF Transcript_40185/g.94726 Transcript_40185/m.94726 type:complete len:235 (-) Transcript_40185:246-950(-)